MSSRLLIIDDDTRLAGAFSSVLKKYGYDCLEADSGRAGVGLALQSSPNLILCDHLMADMTGAAVVQELRGDARTAAIPVILMANLRDGLDAAAARRLGVSAILQKPFHEQELISAIAAYARPLADPAGPSSGRGSGWGGCSDLRQRQILNSIAEGITFSDRDDQILFANPAAAQILGCETGTLEGRNLREFLSAGQHEQLQSRWRDARPGEEKRFELLMRRLDGKPLVLEFSVSAHVEGGGGEGMLSIFRDVTERREEEERLKLATAALNAAVNAIVITTANGIILWTNPAFTVLTGYTMQEAVGQTPRVLKSGHHDQSFYAGMWATVCAGKPWRGELVNQRKDGSLYHEEMTITPVRDAEGKTTHFIAVKSDISARKRAEERLRESEALYRSIMNNLQHCVFRKDRDGRFVFANQHFCQLLGRTEVDVLGRTDADLFPAKLAEKYRNDDLGVLATGENLHAREEFVTGGGGTRVIEINKFAIRDAAGDPVAVQGIFWDITERVEAERARTLMEVQLRHAQKMESIGQLAAGIAHEINTPTQYVGDNIRFLADAFGSLRAAFDQSRRMLDAVRDGSAGPELAREIQEEMEHLDVEYLLREIPAAVEQSLHGVGRVAGIVRAMKEFSHPGSEEKAPLDINHAIENTVAVARNEWKYVSEIVTRFEAELPKVPCVAGEFNQVILNLVVNAAHAIGEAVAGKAGTKGIITIVTRRLLSEVEIAVEDTGSGIPEGIRSRIFDPFFTTKPVGRGTGQGLAIVHSIVVDKHGGSIRFETEIGRGTTFFVRLPIQSTLEPA